MFLSKWLFLSGYSWHILYCRLAKLSATFVKNYSEGSEFAASGKDFEVTSGNDGVTHSSSQVLDIVITIKQIAREITKQEYELETGQTVAETKDCPPVNRPAIRRGEILPRCNNCPDVWRLTQFVSILVALPKFRAHTTLPPAPSVENYSIQPRHKPDAPGSLVLPRPSEKYVSQYNKRYWSKTCARYGLQDKFSKVFPFHQESSAGRRCRWSCNLPAFKRPSAARRYFHVWMPYGYERLRWRRCLACRWK